MTKDHYVTGSSVLLPIEQYYITGTVTMTKTKRYYVYPAVSPTGKIKCHRTTFFERVNGMTMTQALHLLAHLKIDQPAVFGKAEIVTKDVLTVMQILEA